MDRQSSINIERLPPPDARLIQDFYDPAQKIATPVDARGLVKIPELIAAVKATVDPAYKWPLDLDVHHVYWPEAWYPYKYDGGPNPGGFRNLTIHKFLTIRSFQEWLHQVSIPPEPPAPKVMQYRTESWMIARGLFEMARETVNLERKARRRHELIAANPNIIDEGFDGDDVIAEEYMAEQFDRNFRGLELHRERNEKIPKEHRFIELDKAPEEIARSLGRLVVPKRLNLVPSILAA